MAPSFDNLTEDNGTYDSEEELDFSGTKNSTIPLHFLWTNLANQSPRQISKNNMMSDSNKVLMRSSSPMGCLWSRKKANRNS